MKIKKIVHGDYQLDVIFNAFSHHRVHVVLTDNLKRSCIRRYGACDAHDNADAFCRHAIDGRSHVFLPITETTPNVAGTIAHEAWHCIHHMFNWYGVKDFDNEVVAYHVGYLVEQIHKFKTEVLKHVSETSTTRGLTISLQSLHTRPKTKTS